MKPFGILVACLLLVANLTGAELRVGAAAVRIMPEQPLPMAGYYSIRLSTNTHDELHAKAIVLEQDGARAALVVCDLISLPRTVVVQARVPGANVMISAAHSHTGPVLDTGSSRKVGDLVTGKGASTDVIEASARAYLHSVNRFLCNGTKKEMTARKL